MATVDWENVARNLAGALDSCTTQIEQMKGMFPDDDGLIEQALQEADDAVEIFADAAAGTPKPRFYTHFKSALTEGGPDSWETSAGGVQCGRFAVQDEDIAMFPELAAVDSVLVWNGGIETHPPLPDINLTKPLALANVGVPMPWINIDKALPPDQKNIVVMLWSGIPLLGRNIAGRFCVYDSINDRMVEWMEDSKDGFCGISSWCEIPDADVLRKSLAATPAPDETIMQSIAERIRDAGDENILDDILHDAFADQASAVNNAGLEAQIRYLLANDFTEDMILEKANLTAGSSLTR